MSDATITGDMYVVVPRELTLSDDTVIPAGTKARLIMGERPAGGDVAWLDITDKPPTFPPSAHEHGAPDITSGVLPVARGGTGVTTIAGIIQALYAPGGNRPNPEYLLSFGGGGASSGYTSLAQLRTAMGLDIAKGSNWVRLPGGFILQWGEGSFNGATSTVVTLPLTFPSALLRAFGTDDTSSASVFAIGMDWGGSSRAQIKFVTTGTGAWGFSYWAIGA